MRGSLRRAGVLVTSLLDFACEEPFALELIDLPDFVKETAALLDSELVTNDVSLEYQFEETIPQLLADRVRIEQVLLNLLRNAIQATVLSLEQPTITVTATHTPEGISIEVRDNGNGIAEEHAARLFDPFFSTKRRGQGFFTVQYAREFEMSEAPGFEEGVDDLLDEFEWPGNVRQLQNIIRSALLDAKGFAVSIEIIKRHLHSALSESREMGAEASAATAHLRTYIRKALDENTAGLLGMVTELESCCIEEALRRCSGNQTAAAKLLQISRATIQRKLRQSHQK